MRFFENGTLITNNVMISCFFLFKLDSNQHPLSYWIMYNQNWGWELHIQIQIGYYWLQRANTEDFWQARLSQWQPNQRRTAAATAKFGNWQNPGKTFSLPVLPPVEALKQDYQKPICYLIYGQNLKIPNRVYSTATLITAISLNHINGLPAPNI